MVEEMKNKLQQERQSATSSCDKIDTTSRGYDANHESPDNRDDEMIAMQLIKEMPPNNLFMSCCFYLEGFEDNDDWMISMAEDTNDYTKIYNSEESGSGKQQLLRLIRRAMGTVFWDVHECITHVIVADGTDAKRR